MNSWREVIKPLTDKCDLGVKFNGDVCFTPEGASAVRQLLVEMADKLDDASTQLRRQKRWSFVLMVYLFLYGGYSFVSHYCEIKQMLGFPTIYCSKPVQEPAP